MKGLRFTDVLRQEQVAEIIGRSYAHHAFDLLRLSGKIALDLPDGTLQRFDIFVQSLTPSRSDGSLQAGTQKACSGKRLQGWRYGAQQSLGHDPGDDHPARSARSAAHSVEAEPAHPVQVPARQTRDANDHHADRGRAAVASVTTRLAKGKANSRCRGEFANDSSTTRTKPPRGQS